MNNLKTHLYNTFITGWRGWFWLVVIGLILYSPTLLFSYHYLDDNDLIMNNMDKLSQWSYLGQAWQEGVFHSPWGTELYYRPLLTISFMWDAHMPGNSLFFFHLTNIILHLLATLLFYLILKKIWRKDWLNWLAALLFLIHPINLQAIAWLPGRNDSLLAVFVLAAFYAWLCWCANKKIGWLILYFIGFALALLTKESAIFLPMLSLLYLYIIKKEKIFALPVWQLSIPTIIIAGVWWWLRINILPDSTLANYTISQSLIRNLPGLIPSLGKIFIPVNLSTFPILADMPMIYGFIAMIILIIIFSSLRGEKMRWAIFGFTWFLLFLIPSFLRPLNAQIDFAEHRNYLPLLGMIIILLQYRPHWINSKTSKLIAGGTATVILIIFTGINFVHARVYKDNISFWTNAVETSPTSAFNRNNLGAMYYISGKLDDAAQQWRAAIQLNPREPLVQNNLGLIAAAQGNYEQAEKHYLKELTLHPDYTNALFNLGITYLHQNKPTEAAEYWEKTLAIDPAYWSAYQNLIILYTEQKDNKQAKYWLTAWQQAGGKPPDATIKMINQNK
ncbi:MAG: tetratricopeptide repeat protein [Candidatus Komeilibacteria bacterium]